MSGTRRRNAQLLEAIHQATLAEMAENGVAGLTMDGIAQRAGASRTSLYRRWTCAEELAAHALQEALVPADTPEDTGNLRADLIAHFDAMAHMARSTPIAAAIGAVLAERGRHPDLVATVQERAVQPGIATIATILDRAAHRGDIQATAITDEACAIGPALMVTHHLIHGSAPDNEAIARIVDHAVLPALRRAEPDQRKP